MATVHEQRERDRLEGDSSLAAFLAELDAARKPFAVLTTESLRYLLAERAEAVRLHQERDDARALAGRLRAALMALTAKDIIGDRTDGWPWADCAFCHGPHFDMPEIKPWPEDVPWTVEEHDRRDDAYQKLCDAFVPHTDHTPDCPLVLGRAALAPPAAEEEE